MELVAIGVGVLLAAGAWVVRGRAGTIHATGGDSTGVRGQSLAPLVSTKTGTSMPPTGPPVDGAQEIALLRERLDTELGQRRNEIARLEERILEREESLERRLVELDGRERSLIEQEQSLRHRASEVEEAREQRIRELERVGTMSRATAREALVRELEGEARHEAARTVRHIEEEARLGAERRVRSILSACMQRIAAGHAAETTVSLVELPSDDMKGRIIGREGRNIRALESITGVDFIIDDTPSAVVLSSFDGVRRQIAKLTLERLVQDGRIHPARIEEAYYQARSEIENHIIEQGEQAMFEANVHGLHPEMVKLLGRLRYRTSYGQNVLSHSIEVSRLAGMMAAELGAGAETARRAALLHDIGKAVSHETEGPHALIGGDLARRYRETEAVAHAMEAHHHEVEMRTVEAVIVQVADSLSGARPGARGESLENYVKRLRDLEAIAERHSGVEKVYAIQAGREIRVTVAPNELSDDDAALLSHEIAREIEREVEYPGQIKVTVIRESRTVEIAK